MKTIFIFAIIGLIVNSAHAQSLKTDYAFRKYLLENVRYPEAAIEQGVSGRAYAFFEVGSNGKVTNIKTTCGHQGIGFEQVIEQTLLAAPTQAKSAVGKYLVDFEFNLLLSNGQRQSNEAIVGNPLAIPEGTVKLNTVKIEATASAKMVSSVPAKKTSNTETNRTIDDKPTTRAQTKASTTALSEGLSYTMRKVEREFDWTSKKTGKSLGAITAYYEYPTFSDEKINVALRNKLIKKSSFEAAADAYIADQKETYANFKDEDFGLSGLGQGYSLSIKVIRQNPHFVFFKADWSEENEGAAHGQYGEAYLTYDRSRQQMIGLDDIMTGGGRYELRQIAERVFRREEKLSPNASLCDNYLFDKCKFELAENFTVTENTLEFIYNPYEGKSFAAGIWPVKIPYSLIKHLIKPEYGALFGQTAKEVVALPKATAIAPKTSNGTLSYIKAYDGQYPSQTGLFEKEELPQRMKKLMGAAAFAKFVDYAQQEQLVQLHNGHTLITSCKPDNCGKYESVVFVDTGLDRVYIGLLDNNQVQTWSDHPAFKSYDPTSMPAGFKEWFLEASGKARERRGNEPKKMEENEKISSTRSSNLLGANSPEELAKILLQALKNNDKKMWMRHLIPGHTEGEIRFDQHRECLSQQGISNWSSVIFSRMTYSLRGGAYGKADPSTTIPHVSMEFTYQNKEFFGRLFVGEFLKYEGKWFANLNNLASSCEVTRYQRN